MGRLGLDFTRLQPDVDFGEIQAGIIRGLCSRGPATSSGTTGRLQQSTDAGQTQFVLFRQVPDPDAGGVFAAELGNLVPGQFQRKAKAHPLGPGSRDPFRLTFFPEVRLELRDRGQDSEHELAGRGRGVDGLIQYRVERARRSRG